MSDVLFTPANIYKDIHKGIRAELFGVTAQLGSLDAADEGARAAAADRVGALGRLLEQHAEHEDEWLADQLELHVPHLADTIVADHASFDSRLADLAKAAAAVTNRREVHELYLDAASFTSDYLRHQDIEEREVLPALLDAMGPEVLTVLHLDLVASIPPPDMGFALTYMIPGMNIDDRADLLGGVKATAPAEVFAGVWALAGSVLAPADLRALGARLDGA